MCKIVDETIKMARACDLTVKEICQAADIKPRWFYRFINRDFPDPGINKVLRLHQFLSRRKQCRAKAAA